MDEDRADGKTVDIIHYSVGSTTTGLRASIDLAADDPEHNRKIDAFLEKWLKASIVVTNYVARLKGG